MRHKFLVLTVKKWLKSVYIYGSYRKIKTGVSLFLDHSDSVDTSLASLLYSCTTDAVFSEVHDQWARRERRT